MAIAAQELHDLFDLIHDNVQSLYFSNVQKDTWLSLAQVKLFKHFYDSDGSMNVPKHEDNRKLGQYLSPFLVEASGSSANGLITHADITSDNIHSAPSFSVSFATLGSRRISCRPIVKSEESFQEEMSFYSPNVSSPVVIIKNGSYQIKPDSGITTWYAIAYKSPTNIDLAQAIGSDFQDSLKSLIAYQAVMLAGMSARDNQFVNELRTEINQIGL